MAELERKGIIEEQDAFIDADSLMIPGASIRDMLRKIISSVSKVVLLWTENSSPSQFMNYEAGI